jgi:hypothetical protein
MTHLLYQDPLDPEAPGLDEETRVRRRLLAQMAKLSPEELVALAKRAGILTPEGELAEYFQNPTPSPYRDALTDNALDLPILELLSTRDALRPDEIAALLGARWVVSENEIWGRLRRMAGFPIPLVTAEGVRYSVTEAGREAERQR